MFYVIPAIFIDLSPTHREIIAFEFVAELMEDPVYVGRDIFGKILGDIG